jgi:class 3 adenylate cyclase
MVVSGAAAGGLPGGAVTFVFSDIEGSTRLVKALRDETDDLTRTPSDSRPPDDHRSRDVRD